MRAPTTTASRRSTLQTHIDVCIEAGAAKNRSFQVQNNKSENVSQWNHLLYCTTSKFQALLRILLFLFFFFDWMNWKEMKKEKKRNEMKPTTTDGYDDVGTKSAQKSLSMIADIQNVYAFCGVEEKIGFELYFDVFCVFLTSHFFFSQFQTQSNLKPYKASIIYGRNSNELRNLRFWCEYVDDNLLFFSTQFDFRRLFFHCVLHTFFSVILIIELPSANFVKWSCDWISAQHNNHRIFVFN